MSGLGPDFGPAADATTQFSASMVHPYDENSDAFTVETLLDGMLGGNTSPLASTTLLPFCVHPLNWQYSVYDDDAYGSCTYGY